MKINLILPLVILLACACGIAQTECGIPSRDIILVDTVEVHDPIVLGFVEEVDDGLRRVGVLLVPKCIGDTAPISNGAQGFYKCLTTVGYLFYAPGRFADFLSNALYHHPNGPDAVFLRALKDIMLAREKDAVFIKNYDAKYKYDPLYYRGLEALEIRQRRFWLFLVKNSTINSRSSDEELTIDGNDSMYLRVLVPITR